jgi:polyisoprenoid-binding protein YceI
VQWTIQSKSSLKQNSIANKPMVGGDGATGEGLKPMKLKLFAATALIAMMAACAQPAPAPEGETSAEPTAVTAVAINAPAGVYALDKSHATVTFQVMHLGLSRYTARFTDFDAQLTLDPANPIASSVTATINPASVETDYPGNYRATHQGSAYRTWDEDLARNPNWFNAGAHPTITFASTGLTLTGERTGTMTGNLTFLGQTHPVTLDVTFNGEHVPHPFRPTQAAIGFSARGSLNRSTFGMGNYIPNIADEVQLIIEAEFFSPEGSVMPPAPAATPTDAAAEPTAEPAGSARRPVGSGG